ncbi:MAG: hypothetical protein JNJ69_09060 [Leptospiraceae bacterium]|nr:hypothetical protein [Leptospiraceae bacterium]
MTDLKEEIEVLRQRISALEESRLTKIKTALRRKKTAVKIAIIAGIIVPVAIYAAAGVIPYSFSAGSAAVATEVNANFTYLNNVSVPIGGIIAWHQDLTGVPALPGSGEWVKCDGQTLSDANSPMNGQVIPNLNGNGLGANSPGHTAKVQMFLRGGTTSGTGQQDAFQGHWHQIDYHTAGGVSGSIGAAGADTAFASFSTSRVRAGNAFSDGSNGTPRTASETRPSNMSVVWIMRVK